MNQPIVANTVVEQPQQSPTKPTSTSITIIDFPIDITMHEEITPAKWEYHVRTWSSGQQSSNWTIKSYCHEIDATYDPFRCYDIYDTSLSFNNFLTEHGSGVKGYTGVHWEYRLDTNSILWQSVTTSLKEQLWYYEWKNRTIIIRVYRNTALFDALINDLGIKPNGPIEKPATPQGTWIVEWAYPVWWDSWRWAVVQKRKPENIEWCLINGETKEKYCTREVIEDKRFEHGWGYRFEVPAGYYSLWFRKSDAWTSTKSFHLKPNETISFPNSQRGWATQ